MGDTMTVKQACDHGRYERHPHPDDPTLNDETGEWGRVCPGGKEIVLRRATRFDGSITMENQVMWVEADDATL